MDMALKTPGKRTPATKALGGTCIKENTFNRAVVVLLEKALLRCGFAVLCIAPNDEHTTLKQRVVIANSVKADFYVSVYYEAYGSKFDGYAPLIDLSVMGFCNDMKGCGEEFIRWQLNV